MIINVIIINDCYYDFRAWTGDSSAALHVANIVGKRTTHVSISVFPLSVGVSMSMSVFHSQYLIGSL